MALDPREAAAVLEDGSCTIDGEEWRCQPWGDGGLQRDGRVAVRLMKV